MAENAANSATQDTPRAMSVATVLLFGALALGVLVAFVRARGNEDALAQLVALYLPFGWLVMLALPVWLIARIHVGAAWARTALLVLALLQLAGLLLGFGALWAHGALAVMLELLRQAAIGTALGLLFRGRGVREWFRPVGLDDAPDSPAAGEADPAGGVIAPAAVLQAARAPLGRRLAAFAIDTAIVLVICALASAITGAESTPLALSAVVMVVALALLALYFAWPFSTNGRTPGMTALSIKVVAMDGAPLSWRTGVLRTLGYVIGGIPLYAGFLWAFRDRDQQAWHDKLAGTCVVREAVAREQLAGAVAPQVLAASRRRWQRSLGIPALIAAIAFGAVATSWFRGELGRMSPWPEPGANAATLAPADLARLGLQLARVEDPRVGGVWARGHFDRGAMTTYVAGGRAVACVWALEYGDHYKAMVDFSASEGWLAHQAHANRQLVLLSDESLSLFGTGVRAIATEDIAERTYLRGHWIVAIWAVRGASAAPRELTALIRDATGAQWRTRAGARTAPDGR